MNEALFLRLVVCFESLAQSMAGINATKQKEFAKQYPEAKPVRDAVVTRIPNEEDKILQAQGVDGTPLEKWLSLPEEEEFIGEREREYLEKQKRNASPEAPVEGPDSGRTEAVGGQTE